MKIAVSACLLGEPCRYDGAAKPCADVLALASRHELVAVCPEVAGGLPTPRPASEIEAASQVLRVVNARGEDVTSAFELGAACTCALAQREGCEVAILKSNSPSCSSERVYDGTFTGTLVEGLGVTARALLQVGIPVRDEHHLKGL